MAFLKCGDTIRALNIAKEIIDKPVKVHSSRADFIIKKAVELYTEPNLFINH